MAITSNSVQNNQNRSGNLNTNAAKRTYRTNGGMLNIREGETLKGVVSDIHGNRITISLDDGSSFSGTLPEASQYSIGQKAAFQITSLEGGTIYMKAVSQAYVLGMEDTVEQALEEAGLPKSPRNLEVVRSLLENQQSISKQNIMDSLKLCARYPQADVNTVISMKRLGMPMDAASVTQFDNYQNQTHQLLYRMNSLTDSVNDLLLNLVKENPSIARYAAGEVLNIALDSIPSLEEFNLTAMRPTGNAEAGVAGAGAELLTENGDKLSPEADNGLSSETSDGLPSGTDPASGRTGETASSPFARMRQLLTNMTDRASATKPSAAESASFIPEQAGHILSTDERSELAAIMEKFSADEESRSLLKDGTLTAREILTAIKDALPSLSDEDLHGLLDTKGFGKLVKGQFLSGWTLSPEGLKEENGIERLYGKMQEQLSELSSLNRMFATRPAGESIVNTTADMQQNMEFMKMLNEQFTYLQLPMKLSEQNAHGDLYVMTRKNALKKSKDNLKVLLHLEMDSLGILDIHITKEHTNISTTFFVEKDAARKLLEKNADLLKDAINKQGYSFTSEFAAKQKDIDLVHDFMEQDSPAPIGSVTRYNFDLRA
ncbi:MAG: flagellar hook-length control protein FliK [Eubacterium sp.]|jgi:hypothetical protein|nr:flagellar hook-length control protein FliK [Eubacterium sp.]